MATILLEGVQSQNLTSRQEDGNKIVISGMSGLYPNSHNVMELSEILYNKVNPVTSENIRYTYNHPEVAPYIGTIPGIEYFDAQFFKVSYRLAICMDPMSKKILEQAYQAIYDAGINSEQLSGKKVGVYIGACFSEMEKSCLYSKYFQTGLGVTGCNKSMFANRISYWLNAKGPSMCIDESCCSSTAALEQAYMAMSHGECEAAVVGGCHICLHPQSAVHCSRIINMCRDGKTKSFDECADGCARSEVISVLFLQKAKDAMRIYAKVVRAKTEFNGVLKTETGPKYGFYRDLNSISDFLENFYQEARIPPQVIEYVEALGCATPEVDKIELQAIEKVICKNKDKPLMIGSVMSNIGYTEAASGISAITKVLLCYHNGLLAANLHCDQPRKDIAALCDGRMRIVNNHQPFDRTYVAVNGMSITGANSHVLLYGCYKPKNLNRYASSIPHLVTISARHEEAVKYVIEILKSNPIDPEQLALLHNIQRMTISGHLARGFVLLETNEKQKTVSLCEKNEYFDNARRPLWFVYSGMGSQWAGMGKQLMRIPTFAAAIERCRITLKPKGVDIVDIITSDDDSIFDNILHSFVGIAAIQIGLTDILHELGLKPDGIIGHSVGELGCAYADNCLTAEEMILCAYYRGLVSVETKFIHGSMAAVGMGYTDISNLCPPEIEVACHNGPDSSTISGPSNIMREFVAKLTAKGIFAREVPCSNIAYHSRYIADAGPGLLKYLQGAIGNPKDRSERWLSTSVPKDKWDQPLAKTCSAEYLTNNLLNPVLFEETSRLVPSDAVLVEIAPHGLLQPILKRSMPASCKNIALTRRKHPDNAVLLLEAVGKLYLEGYNPHVQVLYPKVEMPVSTGTPFLSHLVKWAHDEKWLMPLYHSAHRKTAAHCSLVLSLHDAEHTYLKGHSIRGNILYPFAASLTLVWDLLAMLLGVTKKKLSVEFSDLHLYSQPVLHDQRQLKLNVSIQRGTGFFEVYDNSSKVATGLIKTLQRENRIHGSIVDQNKPMYLHLEDIYQFLRERDYFYSDTFQSIACVDDSLSEAKIVWRDNWTTFIDSMLQLNALRQSHNAVSQPRSIRRIVIDTAAHKNAILDSEFSDGNILLRAKVSEKLKNTRCGGVIIENIKFLHLPSYTENEMDLKSLNFIPFSNSGLQVRSLLEVYFQIVAENLNKTTLTVVGVENQVKKGIMFENINGVIQNTFGIKVNYKHITREMAIENYKFEDVDMILVENVPDDDKLYQRFQEVLERDKFIINEINEELHGSFSSVYCMLSVHTNEHIKLQLIRWGQRMPVPAIMAVSVHEEADLDILTSVRTNLPAGYQLLIIASYPTPSGLKELISIWRNETDRNNVLIVTINNSGNDNIVKNLHDVNLTFNNVVNGNLGGKCYLPLKLNQNKMTSENVSLQGAPLSDFDSLKWVAIPELSRSGFTVNVHYAGINTNDLKKANGLLLFKNKVNSGYGMDYSGITESGKRVMGIVHNGAASKQVKALPELLWPVPAHWSLEDAATVPLAYVQAFYCLGIKTRLPRGKSVFVHGGAGALGQAIISIALYLDCEVFTTVSNIHKKNLLLKLFPTLKADHIGCSRDNTFTDMVEIISKGKRCHIAISCVKGNLKDCTLRCLNFGGVLYDISQIQDGDDYNFGMSSLRKEGNYVSVDFSSVFDVENLDELKTIHKMVSEGITGGFVRPLSRVTYAPRDVARAFRLLAASSHRGRVLLRMADSTVQAQYRMRCNTDKCNLILCGKTAFGLQFADRLVARGAKQLCIHVPTQTPYLQHKMRAWQSLGIQVTVSSEPLNKQKTINTLLKSSLQLGQLEGVYIIAEETDADHNLISNLDAELRKLCCDLSHFAVVYFGHNSTGKDVCLKRLSDQFPALILQLPEIKEASYGSYMNWQAAVDALEQALQSAHGVTIAHQNKYKPSLLQQIAKLVGLSNPDNATKSLTLEELGIQNHKLQLLCTFLQIQYNLTFDEKQVSSLTINTLLNLERNIFSLPHEDIRDLSTFINYIDSDELTATTELVILPTLITASSMRDDEFRHDQIKLCIVPGLEGHHERFRVLCERLKIAAVVVQPGLDHPNETTTETAQRYAEVLLNKTETKDKFYLLGYESGICIALEIAAILESHGLTGTVFCVGCTPEELKTEFEEQLSPFENEEQLQDKVLRHMYSLMTENDPAALDHAIQNLSTCSQKIEACEQILLGRVSHSAQYARSLIECALARINQIRNYSIATRQLRSQVILIRAAIGHSSLEDSVLQHISQQPLVVHQLNAPLAHITADLRCSAIINEHLDPKIREEFSNRNTCDTYLLNVDNFITLSA